MYRDSDDRLVEGRYEVDSGYLRCLHKGRAGQSRAAAEAGRQVQSKLRLEMKRMNARHKTKHGQD